VFVTYSVKSMDRASGGVGGGGYGGVCSKCKEPTPHTVDTGSTVRRTTIINIVGLGGGGIYEANNIWTHIWKNHVYECIEVKSLLHQLQVG
jgi:hypothetical protein